VKSPIELEKPMMLPLEPFQGWLNNRLEAYNGSPSLLADVIGMSTRKLDQLLTGVKCDKRIKDRHIREVSEDDVDKACQLEGSSHIMDIYPWLYS
jgi:hypothetical protein